MRSIITNPLTAIVLSGLGGSASIVYGVYLLVGSGWAFLAAGAFALFFAVLISKGLNNG